VAALAAVPLLVFGYLPLTAFDHLHLHIAPNAEFFHDHPHLGHHDHGGHHHHHDAEPAGDDPDHEGSDEPRRGVFVVSYGQSAQLRPGGVEIPAAMRAAGDRTIRPEHQAVSSGPCHPSWNSRAPPA
jgi:hypothetical protein